MNSKKFQTLKVLACITMLIDHFAYFFKEQIGIPSTVFLVMRVIGRMAFPLFAFLLVESFFYTKKRWKHCFTVLLIAFISEVPFDIVCTHGSLIAWQRQNVCFTLFLGFLMMQIISTSFDFKCIIKSDKWNKLINAYIRFVTVCIMAIISQLLAFEYGMNGIFLIAILYIAHNAKEAKCGKRTYNQEIVQNFFYTIALAIFVALQYNPIYYICYVDLLLIFLAKSDAVWKIKDGENKRLKVVLRYFYPVHLTLLILIRLIISW